MESLSRLKSGNQSKSAQLPRSDHEIQSDINVKLEECLPSGAELISVYVENGEVTLEGDVSDSALIAAAQELALSVSGSQKVNNNLWAPGEDG